jgi:hypothetical protein
MYDPHAATRTDWVLAPDAAEILGCHVQTVREYGYSGIVATRKEGRHVWFRREDVLALAREYPKGSSGRRTGLPARAKENVSRGIAVRVRLDGSRTYYANVTVGGETLRRTFRSLGPAERWRDREIEKRRTSPAPVEPTPEPSLSFFRRVLARLSPSNPKTEEVSA